MAYTVNKFDGLLLTTINDGTIDTTSSSIKLLGKGVTNYGEAMAENMVHLIENFARTSPPSNPQIGQLWYHVDANGVGNHVMKVCKSVSPVEWVVLGGVVAGGSSGISGFPSNPSDGDLFWDGDQLYAWDDSEGEWRLIGPMSTASEDSMVTYDGDLVSDGAQTYAIIKVVVNGKIVAIFSDNLVAGGITPNPAVDDGTGNTTGFPKIYGGMTLHADYADSTPFMPLNSSSEPTDHNAYDQGSSTKRWRKIYTDSLDTNSIVVGGSTVGVDQFLRSNQNNIPATDGNFDLGSTATAWRDIYASNSVQITSPSGYFKLGVGSNAQRPTTPTDGMVRLDTSNGFEGYWNGSWQSLGGTKDVDGDTYITAEEPSAGSDNDVLKFYAGGSTRLEIGATASTLHGDWNLATGATLESTYADIAEKYESDMPTEPGDIVKLGGEAEVTKTTSYADEDVFGVVSSNPAYVLNSEFGPNDTHPAVALKGRVPCKVVGPVKKGQRIVTSDIPGVGRAVNNSVVRNNPLLAVGRALETVEAADDEITLVEITIAS